MFTNKGNITVQTEVESHRPGANVVMSSTHRRTPCTIIVFSESSTFSSLLETSISSSPTNRENHLGGELYEFMWRRTFSNGLRDMLYSCKLSTAYSRRILRPTDSRFLSCSGWQKSEIIGEYRSKTERRKYCSGYNTKVCKQLSRCRLQGSLKRVAVYLLDVLVAATEHLYRPELLFPKVEPNWSAQLNLEIHVWL